MRQVGDWTHAVGERVGAGPPTVAAMMKAAMAGYEKDEMGSDLILEGRGDFLEIDNAIAFRLFASTDHTVPLPETCLILGLRCLLVLESALRRLPLF